MLNNIKKWITLISIFGILICIPSIIWLEKDIAKQDQEIYLLEKKNLEIELQRKETLIFFEKEKEKWIEEQRKQTNSIQKSSSQKMIDKFDRIINCLIFIESEGRSNRIGDNGKAVGVLQIHPITIEDVNQIIGSKKYKLSDRKCPVKSREIARIYLQHYTNKNWNAGKICRVWNGGPDGWKKWSTEKYKEKFLTYYKE